MVKLNQLLKFHFIFNNFYLLISSLQANLLMKNELLSWILLKKLDGV